MRAGGFVFFSKISFFLLFSYNTIPTISYKKQNSCTLLCLCVCLYLAVISDFLFELVFIFIDIVVALAGYLDFLSLLLTPLGGNILNLYLQSDIVADVGRAGLLGTVIMSFPLLTHPARDLINELILAKSYCCSKDTIVRHVSVTIFIVLSTLAIACVTPDIVVVWSVLGSTVAILVAYVFPPLMYMKTLDMTPDDPAQAALLIATPAPSRNMQHNRTRTYTEDEEETANEPRKSRCLPMALCIMGVMVAIVCTFASIYNIITPRQVIPGTGPNDPCHTSNHSNHTHRIIH